MKATLTHSIAIELSASEADLLGTALYAAKQNHGNGLTYEEVEILERLYETLVDYHLAGPKKPF